MISSASSCCEDTKIVDRSLHDSQKSMSPGRFTPQLPTLDALLTSHGTGYTPEPGFT